MNLVRFAAPAVASAVLLTGCVANAAPDQPAAPGSGQLQATITAEGLGSPSVIVVGDVVRGVALATQDAAEAAPQARRAT